VAYLSVPDRRMMQAPHSAVTARHRAFAGRLRAARRAHPGARPIERVWRHARAATLLRAAFGLQLLVRLATHAVTFQQNRLNVQGLVGTLVARAGAEMRYIVERRHSLAARVIEQRAAATQETTAGASRVATRERAERRVSIPRVAMTLARQGAAVASRSADAARAEQSADIAVGDTRTIDAARTASGTALTLLPQELSRVTDHVIQQLDRRVLSYRERTGRV
jgi:hypothetical protein